MNDTNFSKPLPSGHSLEPSIFARLSAVEARKARVIAYKAALAALG